MKATTAAEQVQRWDAREAVWSVEMGGIGPGYEQAIQVLCIEILRDNLATALPDTGDDEALKAFWSTFGAEAITRTDKDCGGYSGAQVGAAKNLAFRMLRDGPAAAVDSAPDDRRIQVSNFWPTLKAVSQ